MSGGRIPNHAMDNYIAAFATFENYNGTITGRHHGPLYIVRHWGTDILVYNMDTAAIEEMEEDYISQTTSHLVARLLRNLPRQAVDAYLDGAVLESNRKRLTRMVGA